MSEKTRQILSELDRDPSLTQGQLASIVGSTRAYVSAVLSKAQRKAGRLPRIRPAPQWTNHFGGSQPLPTAIIGAAGELFAAATLLRQGIPTYRAQAPACPADLVIDVHGTLLRVEVRSAKRGPDGHLRYSTPQSGRYEVLALVEPSGVVTFRPSIEDLMTACRRLSET